MKPTFFESAAAFRRWLERHHASEKELLVGLYKKQAKHRGLTYAEAVDEALCFGWIDGKANALDDERWVQRYTPRKRGSTWSRVNLAKYAALEQAGRVAPAGRAAHDGRDPRKQDLYSFEQEKPSKLPPAFVRMLKASPRAFRFWEAQTPGYRKVSTFWVMSAKQQATRARRMAALVEASEQGVFIGPFKHAKAKPKPIG